MRCAKATPWGLSGVCIYIYIYIQSYRSFYVYVNASNIESWVFVFFNEFDAVSLLYAGFFLLTSKILLHF